MNEDPSSDELTIEQAADVLNVSVSFIADLIEARTLQAHDGGGAGRLASADVLAYRDRADAVAEEALDAMTADAEVAGLYDE
jgi:excisionase family DNA binding protein